MRDLLGHKRGTWWYSFGCNHWLYVPFDCIWSKVLHCSQNFRVLIGHTGCNFADCAHLDTPSADAQTLSIWSTWSLGLSLDNSARSASTVERTYPLLHLLGLQAIHRLRVTAICRFYPKAILFLRGQRVCEGRNFPWWDPLGWAGPGCDPVCWQRPTSSSSALSGSW